MRLKKKYAQPLKTIVITVKLKKNISLRFSYMH